MKLSKDARNLCRELFRLCLVKGKLQEDRVRKIVESLLAKRPRNYLQILRELARLVRLNLAERQAEVQSALPLSPEEASQIEKELKSLHGSDLEIQYRVNPSLLGGLYVRIGSAVWDGTLWDRLRRIADPELSSSPSFRPPPHMETSSSKNLTMSHSMS